MKKAFTLAEIMAVLTILGVVASLTLSTVFRSFERIKIQTGVANSYAIYCSPFSFCWPGPRLNFLMKFCIFR